MGHYNRRRRYSTSVYVYIADSPSSKGTCVLGSFPSDRYPSLGPTCGIMPPWDPTQPGCHRRWREALGGKESTGYPESQAFWDSNLMISEVN